jgi:hypothetical protein
MLNLILSAVEGAVRNLVHESATHPNPVNPVNPVEKTEYSGRSSTTPNLQRIPILLILLILSKKQNTAGVAALYLLPECRAMPATHPMG